MSPDQTALVQATWRRVVPIADAAARSFYDRLFEIDPRLQLLFSSVDLNAQRRKLIEALALVVGSLEHMDGLIPVIEALGRRHANYGVTEAHYATVGAALISTLQQGLGDAWTEEVKAAWVEAYTLVSGVMRAGAARAATGEAEPTISPHLPEDAVVSRVL
jgi:hemoglobin-like flavoprotein